MDKLLNWDLVEVDMKTVIEISKQTMDRLSGSLALSPIYDEDEIDPDKLSYAIKLIVDLCADN